MATKPSTRTPITVTVNKLERLIREESTNCTQLGIQLGITLARLQVLEGQSTIRKELKKCFQEMCGFWLSKQQEEDEDRTWSEVYDALEAQDNLALIAGLKETHSLEAKVVLQDLVNEASEMTSEWYEFGCALDVPIDELDTIKDQGGLQRYMIAMLREWMKIKKSEATWENLQEALRNIGNNRLAASLQKQIDAVSSKPRAAKAGSGDKYTCQVFYQRNKENQNIIQATFAFVLSSKSDGLKDHEGESGPSCHFDLEADKLEIAPKDQAGWSSTVTRNEMSKATIDDCTGKGKLPTCVIKIEPNSTQSTPPKLEMGVELKGSKPAQTMTLELQAANVSTQAPPPATTSSKAQ